MIKKDKDIFIKRAKYTPEVILDRKKRYLSLKGVSYPEDAAKFYAPILKEIQDYVIDNNNVKNNTTIEVSLDYFNTSTAGSLYKIFHILNANKDMDIDLKWYYQNGDSDLLEAGKDFEYIFKDIKFQFHEILIK